MVINLTCAELMNGMVTWHIDSHNQRHRNLWTELNNFRMYFKLEFNQLNHWQQNSQIQTCMIPNHFHTPLIFKAKDYFCKTHNNFIHLSPSLSSDWLFYNGFLNAFLVFLILATSLSYVIPQIAHSLHSLNVLIVS
jgi:hypothetical protein